MPIFNISSFLGSSSKPSSDLLDLQPDFAAAGQAAPAAPAGATSWGGRENWLSASLFAIPFLAWLAELKPIPFCTSTGCSQLTFWVLLT